MVPLLILAHSFLEQRSLNTQLEPKLDSKEIADTTTSYVGVILDQLIKGTVALAADLCHYPHSVCGELIVCFSNRGRDLKGQQ